MAEAFRGEFSQKIDAKARVSIPASFRRVLEAGDPTRSENGRARIILVYGGDNRSWCEGYTVAGMRRLEKRILRMKTGDRARLYLQRNVITLSQEVEVDEDGRIVLPPKVRDKMGLGAGALKDGTEAVFAGMLDSFQLWHRPAYDADLDRQADLARDVVPAGEDMLALLPDEDEDED